ncbi:uncharacterized protein N7500_008598 [Penicillium coprophilum]|uniref:uncharacterized protein n=1 Tax=Penicillium coprophilum TaxID=36646 RepID=UPI0023A0DABF|nr:uncharacterized protein N7500_008598 [Penicillium coprophilum]KAJ5158947.1 hypothetical protein N7500_008598 [Penicillium coprophilum]
MRALHYARGSANYGKLAIATATILGILTLGALTYLLIWYVRRRLRAQRLYHQGSHENEFDQSAVSLAEDTGRTLDDFLMKDIQPERNSIMFNRSRSPSITIIIDDPNTVRCKSPPRPSPIQHGTAASTSADPYTLTQIPTQESITDEPRSDLTQWSSSERRSSSTTPRASTSSSVVPTSGSSQIWTTTTSAPSDQTQTSSSGQHSSNTTPRASISSSVVPTAGSSQIWTTTSAGTETFSLLSQSSNYSHHPQSPTGPSTSRNSQVYTRRSNAASGASSRPSSAGVLQAASRMFNEAEASRMVYSRNMNSFTSTTPTPPTSPVLVDFSAENEHQWTSVPPTPFPFNQV